ncbi:MAG: endolytic transglycosylase MltG, partial [Gemmatimonadales bacterium]
AIRNLLLATLIACSAQDPGDDDPKVTVTIPRGATFAQAMDTLTTRRVITSPTWFGIYARFRGLPANLKSGIYTFREGESWGYVVETLKSGRGDETRFTVLEGMMGFEVAERARVWLRIPRDSFRAAMRDPSLLRQLEVTPNPAGLEGYMYPTTYIVPVGIRARDLMQVMAQEFVDRWRPEWDLRLLELHMTRHEIITLASIIESEVRYDPDRAYVSAVYHNRLKRGMPLQADPTVVYAHGRRLRRVWEKNLRIRSPYNTYRNRGLPPGPISQPSDSSMFYALYPAPVGFLYFVAQPDGKHIFSASYAEHLAAIRRVRRRR